VCVATSTPVWLVTNQSRSPPPCSETGSTGCATSNGTRPAIRW
jgi:hypothetical protein